jgi:hypothetical protein
VFWGLRARTSGIQKPEASVGSSDLHRRHQFKIRGFEDRGSSFRYFQRQEVRVLCSRTPKVMKCDTIVEEDVPEDFSVSSF